MVDPHTPLHRTNTSGHTGVSWNARSQRWKVAFKRNHQTHFVGEYNDLNDAALAAAVFQELYPKPSRRAPVAPTTPTNQETLA